MPTLPLPPLLQVTQPDETLSFLLHGSSSGLEAMPLFQGIDVRLTDIKGAKKVVFDLCDINPVFNTAGRIFDIALHFAPELGKRGVSTIVKMPWDIYEELQRSDDLPQPAATISLEHLEIHLTKSSTFPSTPSTSLGTKAIPVETSLLTYTGEILDLNEETVSVSLFPSTKDGEEIAGEFDRRQFPDEELSIGQTFRYCAMAKEPGKTEVNITLIDEVSIHTDDLLEIWNEVSARIPEDETE